MATSGVIPAGTVVGGVTIPCDVPFCEFETATYQRYNDARVTGGGTVYICYENTTGDNVICASRTTPNPVRYNNDTSQYNSNITVFNYTIDDKTVYYGYINGPARLTNYTPAPSAHPVTNLINIDRAVAWAMIYGGFGGFNVTYDLENCTGDVDNPTIIPPNATITPANFAPDDSFEFVSASCWIDGDGFPSGTPVYYAWEPETGFLRIGPITSDITIHVHAYGDPYADIDGESDLTSDSVPIPPLPSTGIYSTGIVGLFKPSVSQMQLLSDFMWTDFGGTGTTTEDILKEVVQALKRSISNPLDYVIGLNIIPSQGLSVGQDKEVRFGFVGSGVNMPVLTSQYFTVDCGSLSFDALCKNTFLDYAPYSKFSIYLPYVGIKEVDANDFVGHTIGVYYHGDVVTGGITAYITKDGNVFYQYSGCCALTVPLSADSWGTTISGAVQIATSLVTSIPGGSAGVADSAISGAANVAANPSLLSPQVAHSGAVSGGAGLLGVQKPFVIREAVRFHDTAGFNTLTGYPSYYYKKLSDVSGYTVVLDVHLKGVPATNEEITEIEDLLKEGAIF